MEPGWSGQRVIRSRQTRITPPPPPAESLLRSHVVSPAAAGRSRKQLRKSSTRVSAQPSVFPTRRVSSSRAFH